MTRSNTSQPPLELQQSYSENTVKASFVSISEQSKTAHECDVHALGDGDSFAGVIVVTQTSQKEMLQMRQLPGKLHWT
ncbi:unnamed protein product [Cercopithifilaria johnstoni]|uniref:Uncharacterized protein n=1 Tax=Cercopithifilaria johnstoni TaxID=2874296 RepID=A0A8J2MTW5_9BILA|nr:unnamed protein product [Cercopithifilaria johnstoni]